MNGRIAARARRLAASSSWRLAAALATVLVIASPTAIQATPVAASIPEPLKSAWYATPMSPQTAVTARPAALNPTAHARPQGHTVVPFRTIDPNALRIAKQKAAQAPAAPAPSIARTAPKASIYNNVNQPGIAAGDEGACCTPPDTTGSIGPSHYLEIVNNLVRVYDRSLNRISDADLGTFTGTPAGISTSDPQMQWDAQGNRWLYAAVAFATSNNYLLVGWSKTADPSDLVNGWCHYGIFTANLLQDYPKLGHDNNYLMVGANEYDDRTSGFAFVTANIWALPKPALGDASCAVGSSTHFADPTHLLLNADGSPAFTPIPVNTSDSSNAGYIVAAHSPTNAPAGPQTKVMAWHIVKGSSGPQLVRDGDLTVRSFNIPPAIPQPGATLDSLDARLTQAVGHKDPDAGNAEAVWTQHTVVSTTNRSVVRWYEFIPSQLKVRQQGEISSATDYIFNGAIAPSILGNDAVLFYDRANASLTPVIGAVSRTHADPLSTMGSELLIGSSVAADTDLSCNAPYGPPCRWGDYSGASPDPNAAGVVWGSNQLNGPTFFGYPQWATRNFAVAATVVPDFSLGLVPSGRVVTLPGSTTYTVTITGQGGFSGSVSLSASGLPAGTSAAFSPNPATTTSMLTLTTTSSTPAGTSLFTVTGVNGSLTHAASSTLVVSAPSTYASTIMADGPNAYWRLGETSGSTMVDSTSNANNGAYAGGVTLNAPGAITGDANGAVRLDGSTAYGRAPSSASLGLTGAVSVETWVNWTATPTTTQDLVNKGDGVNATGSAYMLGYVPGCSGCGLGFYTFIGNGFVCACQAAALPAGSWHHLVGTRTAGGKLAFYVDGSQVAAASDGGGVLNTVPVGVGVGATGSGSAASLYPANATLDETAIYPTALSATQVSNHYQAAGQVSPVPGPPNGVSATAGNNQATVSWTAPPGSITGYVAAAYTGTTAKNSTAVVGTSTSATLYGLQGGVAYTIQVRAMNSRGTGGPGTSNAVTPTGAAVTYASTVLGDGPALYYRLSDPSGTVSPDSSGNGNTGTYGGGFTPNQPGPLSNDPDRGVLLDGVSGNIRAPSSSSLNITGALSLEVWIKWTATPTGVQDIIHKGDAVTLTGSAYSLAYIPGCSGCGLGIYTFIGSSYACACQSSPLPPGQWFHLVGTRTAAGQLAFYVNGSLVATATDSGGALNNVPSGVGVGASGAGSGSALYPTNAALDDTAIYPIALSATQVSNHFAASGNANSPAAPSNVTATAGANQATVTWTAPAGSVTAYIATAYDGASARNSVAVAGTSAAATIYGLRAGLPYTVQVRAINSNGTGPAAISNGVTPTGAGSTYASTVLGDGPNLYYRLGDPSGTIAPDSSGNGNTGGYFGGATLNQQGAVLNDPDGAVRSDGSTGYARTPSSTSLSLTGAISVEVWAKWTATPTTAQDLVNKGDGATATGSAYMLGYVPGCGGCGLGFYTFTGNSFVCACQAGAPPAGQWFHLVGTRTSGGQLAFYINGSLVATANDGGGALNSVPSGVGIGAAGGGSGSSLYPADATIDEAAIYPSALTSTQVANHYHAAGY